jgi:stage III sporulation protein AF
VEVLVQIVKNLLVIIMVASFLELLMPDGSIKPFARLAMGLFILVAILNPTLNLLYKEHEFKINLWDYQMDTAKTDEIRQAGEKINHRIIEANEETVQGKMEKQIAAVAMLVPGVEDVDINAGVSNNAVVKVDLTVIPEHGSGEDEKIGVFSGQHGLSEDEKEKIRQKIINVMHNLYGLDQIQININFEGG